MFCATHYSYECGCTPLPPPVVQCPPYVWVVVEVYSKSVQISHGASTQPISGKAAIFQKPEVTQQVAARILGVYVKEEDARQAARLEGAEYVIERHEVVQSTYVPLPPKVEAVSRCIMCDAPWPTSFCKKCEQERFEMLRERDEGIITEQVPAGA